MSLRSVCRVIDPENRHFDIVVTKFMVNHRTDDEKMKSFCLFFTVNYHINYKFMYLSAY